MESLIHSSEIRSLCLMKCSSETLQNLSYFWNTETHLKFFSFFIFHFVLRFFSLRKIMGKNKVARNEKKLHGFSYSKGITNFIAFC